MYKVYGHQTSLFDEAADHTPFREYEIFYKDLQSLIKQL